MKSLKAIKWACLIALCIGTGHADVSQIRALYQSILSEENETHIPSGANLAGRMSENDIRSASPGEVQELLDLGQECFHSSKLPVRGAGLYLFLGVAIVRGDSSILLESYIDDLGLLLNDQDQSVRNGAIAILGYSKPKTSPKAVTLLESHLEDKNNNDSAAGSIAGALLQAGDISVVPRVVALAEQRPSLKANVIQMFGLIQITTEPALNLIHAGFLDSNADTRRVSVDTVGKLPQNVQKGFEPDLVRLIQNPNEDPRVLEDVRRVYLLQ